MRSAELRAYLDEVINQRAYHNYPPLIRLQDTRPWQLTWEGRSPVLISEYSLYEAPPITPLDDAGIAEFLATTFRSPEKCVLLPLIKQWLMFTGPDPAGFIIPGFVLAGDALSRHLLHEPVQEYEFFYCGGSIATITQQIDNFLIFLKAVQSDDTSTLERFTHHYPILRNIAFNHRPTVGDPIYHLYDCQIEIFKSPYAITVIYRDGERPDPITFHFVTYLFPTLAAVLRSGTFLIPAQLLTDGTHIYTTELCAFTLQTGYFPLELAYVIAAEAYARRLYMYLKRHYRCILLDGAFPVPESSGPSNFPGLTIPVRFDTHNQVYMCICPEGDFGFVNACNANALTELYDAPRTVTNSNLLSNLDIFALAAPNIDFLNFARTYLGFHGTEAPSAQEISQLLLGGAVRSLRVRAALHELTGVHLNSLLVYTGEHNFLVNVRALWGSNPFRVYTYNLQVPEITWELPTLNREKLLLLLSDISWTSSENLTSRRLYHNYFQMGGLLPNMDNTDLIVTSIHARLSRMSNPQTMPWQLLVTLPHQMLDPHFWYGLHHRALAFPTRIRSCFSRSAAYFPRTSRSRT